MAGKAGLLSSADEGLPEKGYGCAEICAAPAFFKCLGETGHGTEKADGEWICCRRTVVLKQPDDPGGPVSGQWSYVKKKYKLNMPFLRLAYPARASAFSSNAA